MNRLEYLTETFRRARHKKYESFCVQRICHQLPFDIKPITQQCVRRPDGTRALADLFFPQFDIFVEVDEPFHLSQKEQDQMREMDIINVAGLSPRRIPIPVGDPKGEEIVAQVCDEIAQEIKDLRLKAIAKGTFKAWDPEKENDVRTYLASGFIEVADKAQFPTIIECHQLFGYGLDRTKKTFTGAKTHSVNPGIRVLPASKINSGDWINDLSDDGNTFFEYCGPKCAKDWNWLLDLKTREQMRGIREYHIFLRERDVFGSFCYVFAGNFMIDWAQSHKEQKMIYVKIADRVKTYNEAQAKRIAKIREERTKHAKRVAKAEKKAVTEAKWDKIRQERAERKAIRLEKKRLREEARANRPPSKRGRKPKVA